MKVNWRASPLHAAVVGLLNAMLQVVAAFGVHLNGSQEVAITSVVNSLLVVLSMTLVYATNGNGKQGG